MWQRYRPRSSPDETHTVFASDGWKLHLHRYRSLGNKASDEPVFLLHGLGANAQMFDLGVGNDKESVAALAPWLAAQGYDVWCGDLRGSGASQRPNQHAKRRWDWTFDDFLHLDVPAMVDYITTTTEDDSVHWIGHSLGGILTLCYGAIVGSERFKSVTLVASAMDYGATGSGYDFIRPLRHIGLALGRVPAGTASRLFAPLAGLTSRGLEEWGYQSRNIARPAAQAINAGVMEDVSGVVLFQLASLFTEEGLTSRDGTMRYADIVHAHQYPVHFIAGSRDMQCSLDAVQRTFQSRAATSKLSLFGKETACREEYGHLDLLVGLHAETEVYPSILRWMRKSCVQVDPNMADTAQGPACA